MIFHSRNSFLLQSLLSLLLLFIYGCESAVKKGDSTIDLLNSDPLDGKDDKTNDSFNRKKASKLRKSATYKEVHYPYSGSPTKYKARLSWNNPSATSDDEYENGKFTEKLQTSGWLGDDDEISPFMSDAKNDGDATDFGLGGYPIRKSATYKEVHDDSFFGSPVKSKTRLSWDDPTGSGGYENPTITRKIQTTVNIPSHLDGQNLLDYIVDLGTKLYEYGMKTDDQNTSESPIVSPYIHKPYTSKRPNGKRTSSYPRRWQSPLDY